MSASVSRQLAWIELPLRVLRFDRAINLVSIIGLNRDWFEPGLPDRKGPDPLPLHHSQRR